MEFFHKAKAVRLQSHHHKYLTADEDEESVTQDRNGSSKNAIWTVEFVEKTDNVIRLKSCYGKYLTASNQPFLLGMTGRKVLQTVPNRLDSSIEWEPIREGHQVKLRTRYGQFLRGNGAVPPWRNSVTLDIPYRTTTQDWILWDVHVVEILVHSPPPPPLPLIHHSDYFASESGSPSAGSSKSLSFSRQESSPLTKRPAMELFHKAKAVRLQSNHHKYLTADEDEESVTQDRSGSSKNAIWTVEFVKNPDNVIRLKSCYGKYLTASNQPFLLGMTGRKVLQTVPNRLDSSIEWEPIREGHQVKLRTRYGRFLRGNGGMPPWRNSVTHDIPHRTTTQDWILWDVHVVKILVHSPPPPPLVHHSDYFASESGSPSAGSSKSLSFSRQEVISMKYHPLELLQQIEDEWGLDMPETSEDRIKFLKREFEFLDIFLSLQNLIDEPDMPKITQKVQDLFQDAAVDLRNINMIQHVDGVTSQVQDKIRMIKLEIKAEYSFPKVSADKDGVAAPIFVMDFIDTVVGNLGDLVKIYASSSLLYVPGPKKELGNVFKELKLLRNFVCFVSDRCIEPHSQHINFFNHVLQVAGHAAMIPWLYLPIHGNENQVLIPWLSYLLSNLQTKIKPILPGIRKIYIDVLQALRPAIQSQWHAVIQIEHVSDCVAGFVETLQHNLKELPTISKTSQIVGSTDQIAVLQEMLDFLIPNLIHLSVQDLEFHLQDIDAVMVDSGILVYSLYKNVALGLLTLDLPGTIQHIKTVIYHIIRKEFQSNLPRIHGIGYVDFLLNNLKEFQDRYSDSLAFVKPELQIIQKELESLQPFLSSVAEEQHSNDNKLQHSVALIIGKAYEVEYTVDACVSKKVPEWCLMLWLLDITDEVRAEVTEILQKKMVEVDLVSDDTKFSQLPKTPWINEEIVGFEDEVERLRHQLTRGQKELDVIPIVGMAGGGKTTLANRLYMDASVVSHFDIRAQCCVSSVYSRRGVLLSLLVTLLGSIDETSLLNKETIELAHTIRRILHFKRYLILLDDVCDCRVWDDLKRCFPDNKNGSSILLTTRSYDVANYAELVRKPFHLRLLNDYESFELLRIKGFGDSDISPVLYKFGREIARKCEGLPLSVVLVAGILSMMEKTEKCWSQVANDLGRNIESDLSAIIEQSYQHLPDHLKPCFLYFGRYLEDKEINVSKLTLLWIGEGFVKDREDESLQDIAEGYLENLITRNLVMSSKRSFHGKVKACRIHDQLLEFCKQRAEEEHLLLCIKRDQNDKTSSSGISSHKQRTQHRLAFYCEEENLVEWSSSCSFVGSLLYREEKNTYLTSRQVSQIFYNFKFLKVLDLESVVIYAFPTMLVYLRYFAAQIAQESIASPIANLWNLETLILKPTKGKLKLPITIWKMVKLRHLHIDTAHFTFSGVEELLLKLEVLSSPCFSCAKDVELLSRKAPNLRELRCSFVEFRQELFPKLDFLTRLETLEIHLAKDSMIDGSYNFPSSLRNLTLSNFFLGSCHKSNISLLPNLEVLKLISIFFDNDEWEVNEDEFPQLKVLKLVKCEFFEEWEVSDYDCFPSLEHLVLRDCPYLKEIPTCFGEMFSLRSITVESCSESVVRSAALIKEEQEELGGKDLKVFLKEERDRLSGFDQEKKYYSQQFT